MSLQQEINNFFMYRIHYHRTYPLKMDVYIMKPRNKTEVQDMVMKQHGNTKYEVNFRCIYLLIFFYNTCFNITDTVLLVIKHHIIFGVCLTSNVKFIKVMEQKLRT